MPIQVLMPALSPTMEEGNLAKWVKSEGDSIAIGDVLAEIETDKATMEVESVEEGTLGKIVVAEGTQGVKVNSLIALILEEGEDASSLDAAASASTAPAADEGKAEAPAVAAPVAAAPISLPDVDEDPEIPEGTPMKTQTVREALRDAMVEEMRADERVFLMGEEVAQYQGAYKISQGMLDEFGERRVIDTPITEHGFTGLAAGAAMAGLRPIVEFMTFNFALQAMDHIINSSAKTLYMSGGQITNPIVFRGANGAAARVGAQHSQDFSAWYSSVPGLTVVHPYMASDYKGLMKSAIRSDNPVVFLENEILYGQSFDVPDIEDHIVPLGKARIARKGKDVTIVSFGIGMSYALGAAEELAKDGIEAEVIDLRTLRPLDMDTVLRSVIKTGRCVTVEEGWPQASISSEVGFRVMQDAFDYLDAPVARVTGKDVPMPYAANLEKLALPNIGDVIAAVKAVTYSA
ncbi:pyruvate dehydrogenase complex E1 component subunit beta [Cohaesibacter celericrescens]|uniref:Pyruvate dehydrogenase E1 component subunit beta n=1 Tax=Cohaesibacter celericrescens TaxID=2067669 RepID=A0A2N5XSY8_9HYPH|nr:pyruvate dehydrogenase complex E1 component subunit beta [Cohaesibacter celericrescens]PLW77575.1 pyruvate dehydrogenase complex E1 component subunit beta [Cohaesibacter celericrescens]